MESGRTLGIVDGLNHLFVTIHTCLTVVKVEAYQLHGYVHLFDGHSRITIGNLRYHVLDSSIHLWSHVQ